jgi:hypothetical protein
MKIKPLGILLKNEQVVNHRSVLKLVFNPILRIFGIAIGTEMNKELAKCEALHFITQPQSFNVFKNYYHSWCTCHDYDEVKKERQLF